MKATPLAAERLRREAFLGATDEHVTGDGVELTLRAANGDWLVNWLLSFGTAVTVLSPSDIRQQLAETAREVARHHGNS